MPWSNETIVMPSWRFRLPFLKRALELKSCHTSKNGDVTKNIACVNTFRFGRVQEVLTKPIHFRTTQASVRWPTRCSEVKSNGYTKLDVIEVETASTTRERLEPVAVWHVQKTTGKMETNFYLLKPFIFWTIVLLVGLSSFLFPVLFVTQIWSDLAATCQKKIQIFQSRFFREILVEFSAYFVESWYALCI